MTKSVGKNESSIRTIRNNEVKIRSPIPEGRVAMQKRIGSVPDDKIEAALAIWINEMDQKGVPLCTFGK